MTKDRRYVHTHLTLSLAARAGKKTSFHIKSD
jgi:hypothetical protein